MNSIRTFWSPELKKERELRKEEALRMNTLQNKICQQAAELQVIQNELEKREKDINQLLSESELLDMEEELRRLRRQMHEPRDYTEKSASIHELQTLKTKMERSEMALSEKIRELAAVETRAKCAEEQNSELEKRVEILTKSNTANEAQLQLLQDDLGALRKKLETKNQQIDAKEKEMKKLTQQLEALKNQISDSNHVLQDGEHRIAQLNHRIDQLETLLRDRDVEIERQKQKLLTQPDARIEADLKQQLENAEHDKRKMQETIDMIRKNAELEKQQQLLSFQEESKHHQMTIEYLQQELSDREILLASQNEKISQLDNQLKISNGKSHQTADKNDIQNELEKSQKEVERLLRIIQSLEKEKTLLFNKLNDANTSTKTADYGVSETQRDLFKDKNTEQMIMKRRIDELEEALRESVGITSERDKVINEQKALIHQLSTQMNNLFKEGGREKVLAMNNILMNKDFKAEIQKAMDEERVQYQRQIASIRKESLMSQIKEKEAMIQLLQMSPEQFADQIQLLTRQKEQLRHKLLTHDAEFFTANVPNAGNIPHVSQPNTATQLPPMVTTTVAQVKPGAPISAPNNMWLNSAQTAFDRALHRMDQANSYGQEETTDDDGIWA
uniref:Uncharacterized protein n=1 Tax=Panagrolaimus sp. JU765 TaxID=591449 RepID=A0AC34QU09_9BILA